MKRVDRPFAGMADEQINTLSHEQECALIFSDWAQMTAAERKAASDALEEEKENFIDQLEEVRLRQVWVDLGYLK